MLYRKGELHSIALAMRRRRRLPSSSLFFACCFCRSINSWPMFANMRRRLMTDSSVKLPQVMSAAFSWWGR